MVKNWRLFPLPMIVLLMVAVAAKLSYSEMISAYYTAAIDILIFLVALLTPALSLNQTRSVRR